MFVGDFVGSACSSGESVLWLCAATFLMMHWRMFRESTYLRNKFFPGILISFISFLHSYNTDLLDKVVLLIYFGNLQTCIITMEAGFSCTLVLLKQGEIMPDWISSFLGMKWFPVSWQTRTKYATVLITVGNCNHLFQTVFDYMGLKTDI